MQKILDNFLEQVKKTAALESQVKSVKKEISKIQRQAYYYKNRDRILARRKELKRIKIEEFERKQKEEADRLQMTLELDGCICSAISMPPCSFCENQS